VESATDRESPAIVPARCNLFRISLSLSLSLSLESRASGFGKEENSDISALSRNFDRSAIHLHPFSHTRAHAIPYVPCEFLEAHGASIIYDHLYLVFYNRNCRDNIIPASYSMAARKSAIEALSEPITFLLR